jgi:hypothetical protein
VISPREHQAEAVSQIRKRAGFPVRVSAPAQRLRGTVVCATGSGKTITAAWPALECFRGGRILVMVPTLDLLVQTAQARRRVGHNAPMVAVCSPCRPPRRGGGSATTGRWSRCARRADRPGVAEGRPQRADGRGVLAVQTAQAWRRVGHSGPMVAVCSLEKDDVLEQLGVRTATNAIQLALWAGHGPVVVFATHASLVDRDDPQDPLGQGRVRGPLEAALAGGERLYGQSIAPFDLAVVDEAHSTTGDLGRPWAAIHDNTRIPADFRHYLTATPRIPAPPRPQPSQERREMEIATMTSDPQSPYNEWIYKLGLSEPIKHGNLAAFEIDVLEIHDPSPLQAPSKETQQSRRLTLLHTALLPHAANSR